MKTTVEIPDEIFRRSKATAALRGESLRDFVTEALRERLDREAEAGAGPTGWRKVFGRARSEAIAEVDAIVAEDLERVDPDEWR